MKIGGFVVTSGYLTIGALVHWLLLGPVFHVTSVASWGVLFGWPIVLMILMFLIGLLLLIVAYAVMSAIDAVGLLTQVNRNRRTYKR